MIDTATLNALYRDHSSWLSAWLRRQLGCPEQAADLAHDTFTRLLSSQAREAPPAGIREPRAYLTIVARGLLVDLFRRRDLERAYLADIAALPEDLHPSPEEKYLALEALQLLSQLLETLSPKTRAAWLWSRLDGLAHADIADRLGVSVPRVKQYLATAAKRCYALRYGTPPEDPGLA